MTFLALVCATNYRAVPQNKLLLQRVLLVFVPGIDRDLFEASARLLPNMHRLLGEPTTVMAKSPTVSPGTMASRPAERHRWLPRAITCYRRSQLKLLSSSTIGPGVLHIEATGVPDAPALLAPAGATVSQLFTVPHDRKRKREEGDRAAAAAAAAAQQRTDGGGGSGAANGSPVAAEPEQSRPASQFPISHYVLSYKVSRLLLAGCVAKPGRRCLVLSPWLVLDPLRCHIMVPTDLHTVHGSIATARCQQACTACFRQGLAAS